MSLPLLENKIKNRQCILLLNVTQAGGKGSCLLAEYSGQKCLSDWLARTGVGGGERGMTPSIPLPLTAPPHQTWQKHTFKMRNQDPSLKGSVLFQLDQFPYLLGKYWGFYKKTQKNKKKNTAIILKR